MTRVVLASPLPRVLQSKHADLPKEIHPRLSADNGPTR